MRFDFFRIAEEFNEKKGFVEIYPEFVVKRSKDLMVRGSSFYAIWDEDACLWSTDEYDVQRLVDAELWAYKDELSKRTDAIIKVKSMGNFSSSVWLQFRNYLRNLSDSSHQLDENLTFSNTEVKKEDYVSRRLPYPLEPGDYAAWDELMSVLYDPEERAKIEWAIGAIVSGDAKTIQKFLVFYGSAGTGKSTVLNIIQDLFEGYLTSFEAKALTGQNNAFATEVFKTNPLVAIQHDGDLSKIEDNSKLNSIISHEDMTMNEKYKPSYTARINAFLLMGTNKPVKITDSKSGIIRRLIDVKPTGDKLSPKHYQAIMSQIPFQLGAIAYHCLETYRSMGRDYYSGYRPIEMMLQTDVFFNYIEYYFDIFKSQNGATLKQAYQLYVEYCSDTNLEFKLPQYKFREELKNYFREFHERFEMPDGTRVRSWYGGFDADHFKSPVGSKEDQAVFSLVIDEEESLLDRELADMPAQYATSNETPVKKWAEVTTKLSEIDTSQIHYVKVPTNHIVIDFDLKDERGDKSAERNLAAASTWPPTYAEFSKGGGGIHLHYIYEGDVGDLARIYDEGIEIKVYTGDASLRRRLSKCNSVPVATINSGLPLREKKTVLNQKTIQSEKGLRDLIDRNIRKEIHPGTKPSIDFIAQILEDAYSSGMSYDLTDMQSVLFAFASRSSNQALACIKTVQRMKFKSEDAPEKDVHTGESFFKPADDRIAFFDLEVYPNLLLVSWKYEDAPKESIVRLINPTPQQIEELCQLKLVGFNNRRYDNHILYGRMMGLNNEQIYKLSQKIISGVPNALFGEAYNLSYADIYDFSTIKQGLKKFQLQLGLNHQEMELPWDQPVPEELWPKVGEYCDNDVITTEQVFKDRYGDYVARMILADLSGLSINDTTQKHTSKIVFGDDRSPQEKFIYTDLSEMFPGYKYDFGKSEYKGEITGEGGYVYAEPGMYENVALLDVASMHPTSIEALNLFGEYTENFSALKKARIAIKRRDYDSAREMLGGKLARHLDNPDEAEALSYALKIVINIVYGLTSAKFDNAFRDPRNIDNIVAKRGALFMIDLKHMVQEAGYTVVHIKTDSIKIAEADDNIINLVMQFGEKYGYEFEHEATYEKLCLVNDAVYVAKTKQGKKPAYWTAVGAQFQHPYVFKTLFTKEPIEFRDLCEIKTVTTALYLDFSAEKPMYVKNTDEPHFVGRAGSFVPIKPGCGGGVLQRIKEDKYYAAAGTKGYFWLESEMVKSLRKHDDIDMSYYEGLVYAARETLRKFGDDTWFVN